MIVISSIALYTMVALYCGDLSWPCSFLVSIIRAMPSAQQVKSCCWARMRFSASRVSCACFALFSLLVLVSRRAVYTSTEVTALYSSGEIFSCRVWLRALLSSTRTARVTVIVNSSSPSGSATDTAAALRSGSVVFRVLLRRGTSSLRALFCACSWRTASISCADL